MTKAFSYGNQEIHHNVVALYKLYKQYGITALEQLKAERKDLINQEGLTGFKLYDGLLKAAKETATSLVMQTGDFSYTADDPRTIRALLSNAEYLEMAKEASMQWVKHEQTTVQPMYKKTFEGSPLTLEELIQDQGILSEIGNFVWDGLKLSGAVVLDGYLSTKGLNFADYQTRIDFFSQVFDGYFTILQSEGGAEELIAKREHIAEELGVKPLITEAQAPQFDHDFAVTWDGNLGKWRALTPQDTPKIVKGQWISAGADNAGADLTKNGPLVDNTLYFDSDSGRLFLYGKKEALPPLPSNLVWVAKQSYISPEGITEGALFVPFELSTPSKEGLKEAYWSTSNDAVKGFIQLLSDIHSQEVGAVEHQNMQANEVDALAAAEMSFANGDFAFKCDKLNHKWTLAPDAILPDFEITPGALYMKKSDYLVLPADAIIPRDIFFYEAAENELYYFDGPTTLTTFPTAGGWNIIKLVLVERDVMPEPDSNYIIPSMNMPNHILHRIYQKKGVEKTDLLNKPGDLGQQLLKDISDDDYSDTSSEITAAKLAAESAPLISQDSASSAQVNQDAKNNQDLSIKDILPSNSDNIDFSSLDAVNIEVESSTQITSSMELASGTVLDFNQSGTVYGYLSELVESAANSLLSYIY